MQKERRVIYNYVLCNKLKDLIRTGWKNWNVERERVESVAEHVYGVQQLALFMWSEYDYDIDITKVITMLAVHELEETVIGDLTMFDISKEEKTKIGHQAVEDILGTLENGSYIKDLIFEFDERKTEEAKFAYLCDKLECDLQCRLYDLENCVNIEEQIDNSALREGIVKRLLDENKDWSEMWMEFGRERYPYDENFNKVSKYAETHKINKILKRDTKKNNK